MTPRDLHDVEDDVLERVAMAARVFCFLDYDGTLAMLAPTPEQAAPLHGTAALLAQLAAAPGMNVAVVSGRTIGDVRRFLDVPDIYYIGVHGIEVRLPSGVRLTAPGSEWIRTVLSEIKPRLRDLVARYPGMRLQDKGAVLAVHWRLAAPADASVLRARLADIVQDYQERGHSIALADGHAVAEIRPANITKGTTVAALLASQDAAALPIYIGDDCTDEDAFETLPPHAITVRVGDTEMVSHARYRVADPQAVHVFLRGVLAARSTRPHVSLSACGAP
jgi:trehalose 6-phosphate phosphatase